MMYARDYQDIIGGVVLMAAGTAISIHALLYLSLGSVTQMGPGMFPTAVGLVLLMTGFAIMLPAFFRTGETIAGDPRAFITILASMVAFALLVRPFGMAPAIVALTVIASRADSRLSVLGLAALSAGLVVMTILIFRVGLGLPLSIISWPW